jgi:hypothetical protein
MRYNIDNIGRVIPADLGACAPLAGSGQTLLDAASGADHELTGLVGGATYAATVVPGAMADGALADSTFLFGLLTTATAANIGWVCTPGSTVVIQMPIGSTSLHYQSLASGGTAYLRRLA